MPLNDGVVNAKGFAVLAAGPLFLAAVPVTSWITKENGITQRLVEGLVASLPGTVTTAKVIPALSAWYIFFAFGFTGAVSAAAQAASMPEGTIDNKHPRLHVNNLKGLPLRLRSAHYHLMEMFPAFALAAAMAYTTAPTSQRLVNLLGLHIIMKTFVHFTCYVFDYDKLRSVSHFLATASVINVAWRLATGNY